MLIKYCMNSNSNCIFNISVFLDYEQKIFINWSSWSVLQTAFYQTENNDEWTLICLTVFKSGIKKIDFIHTGFALMYTYILFRKKNILLTQLLRATEPDLPHALNLSAQCVLYFRYSKRQFSILSNCWKHNTQNFGE